MSYSDEPNVISEQTRSKRIYFIIGGLVVFMALLASVAFFPRFIEFQRRNTPVGPNEGSVYFINFEGNRYSLELARPEALEFHLGIVIHPTRERTPWRPEEYHIMLRLEDREDSEMLAWNPELNLFGPSELRFHPAGDFRFEIGINRGEATVWSGRRWSFRLPQGHAH